MPSEFDDLWGGDELHHDRKLNETLSKLQKTTETFDQVLGIELPSSAAIRPTGRRITSGRDHWQESMPEERALTLPDPLESLMKAESGSDALDELSGRREKILIKHVDGSIKWGTPGEFVDNVFREIDRRQAARL